RSLCLASKKLWGTPFSLRLHERHGRRSPPPLAHLSGSHFVTPSCYALLSAPESLAGRDREPAVTRLPGPASVMLDRLSRLVSALPAPVRLALIWMGYGKGIVLLKRSQHVR